MDFLVKTSPSVDWKRGQVTCYIGSTKYKLPTCNINSVDTICDDNSFAGLHVDDDISNSEHELQRGVTISKNSDHVALGENA